VNLLEEKILNHEMEYKIDSVKDLILNDRDKEEKFEELVFYKMIELINQKRAYMFGAQKAVTARVISKHSLDVYKILKELIKSNLYLI